MGSTCINISYDLTAGIRLVMPGNGVSIGALVLVEQKPFLAWVRWPCSDSMETGQHFEVLA